MTEHDELLDSVVIAMDEHRHDLNVALHHGERPADALLKFLHDVDCTVQWAGKIFPPYNREH